MDPVMTQYEFSKSLKITYNKIYFCRHVLIVFHHACLLNVNVWEAIKTTLTFEL